jgi:hypothetical protein
MSVVVSRQRAGSPLASIASGRSPFLHARAPDRKKPVQLAAERVSVEGRFS